MKKSSDFVEISRTYARKLDRETFSRTLQRLNDRVGSDLSIVLQTVQQDKSMDECLSTSQDASEVFNMVDTLHEVMLEMDSGKPVRRF